MDEVLGKLYSKEEADKLYGKALESVVLSTDEVKRLADESPERIMFNFISSSLIILNRKRQTIYGDYAAKSGEVFSVYTTSKLLELIQTGKEAETSFEKREEKNTVTNGNVTLEFSGDCPPDC